MLGSNAAQTRRDLDGFNVTVSMDGDQILCVRYAVGSAEGGGFGPSLQLEVRRKQEHGVAVAVVREKGRKGAGVRESKNAGVVAWCDRKQC